VCLVCSSTVVRFRTCPQTFHDRRESKTGYFIIKNANSGAIMKFFSLLIVLAALQVISAGFSDLVKLGFQHTLKQTKKALDSYTTKKSIDEHGIGLLKMAISIRGEDAFADDLMQSEFAALAPDLTFDADAGHISSRQGEILPLVFLHGMGDSCYNRGMKNIASESGKYMGVYSVCVPTGEGRVKDTLNGFLMNMDDNVDALAAAVLADPEISTGFNCVGLSQGNNLCRGYIQKYNGAAGYPLASTHISVHGPVVGVASLPSCEIDGSHGPLCQTVSQLLGKVAYRPGIQSHLFQADYFRQVKDVASSDYKANSQMARWNNEGDDVDSSINDRFAMTKRFAMIKANADTVIVPRESEWFGAYDEHYRLLSMNETEWYKNDLFGLKTADLAGKILFNSTDGNHLEFSSEQLFGWLDLYAL